MKRNKPLKRKTPLRGNPSTINAWKQRTAQRLPNRSTRRAKEERAYGDDRSDFIRKHPICPVTGERTCQVHHSAKREGLWLNLKRYWIAVSMRGHKIIEENKSWAETVGLMVRIRQTAEDHIASLEEIGADLNQPIFYARWNGIPLWPTTTTQ